MTSSVRSPSEQTSIAVDRKIRIVDGGERRGGLRAFLLGGLVGASAAVAALDRRRRAQRRRGRPRGLAAFESAPVLPRAARAGARGRAAGVLTGARFPGHCADLRVPVPERPHVRALPEDVRRSRRDVRDVRRRPGREAALPGGSPLQGVGLLLDRLRLEEEQGCREGRRVLVVVHREVVRQAGGEVVDRLEAQDRLGRAQARVQPAP